MAQILQISDQATLSTASAALKRGELVAMPTETVYGLAGDATNPEAITSIYEAKGRPRFNPLISHVCDMEMAQKHVVFSPLALKLVHIFWPGPLTLVLPLSSMSEIHALATAGLSTAAVRMPEGFARDLIARFGSPLAAPSANRSGRISPTSAKHVAQDLGERIDLIIDGGRTRVGLESTIVAVEDEALHLLRPGGVPIDALEAAAGQCVKRLADQLQTSAQPAVVAPGMLTSHYAPEAAVRLNALEVKPDETLILFGGKALAGEENARDVFNLSLSGDLREAAANLFDMLKRADATGANSIAVAPIPAHGLGEAINDRLSRAAAPRK